MGGCFSEEIEEFEPNPSNPVATFDTSLGTFKAEIFLDRVPVTASHFIDLCNKGFYDGIHFHRVIPGFMNQFGCPYARNPEDGRAGRGSAPPNSSFKNLVTGETHTRSKGGKIEDEFESLDTNRPGSLSMANTGRPNTGGSQFFVNVAQNSNLDWWRGSSKHPVFGQVIEAYDVVVDISRVDTKNDVPITPIRMLSIRVSMRDEPTSGG